MKIAIVGGRKFEDYRMLSHVLSDLNDVECIVSGGAKGADTLAERYATEYDIEKEIFKANWKQHGRGAGIRRNKLIVENSDLIIAFWDGKSKGTKNTIDTARKLGVKVRVEKYTPIQVNFNPKLQEILEDALSNLHWLSETPDDLHELHQQVAKDFGKYWKSEKQFNETLAYIDNQEIVDIYLAARIAKLSMETLPSEWRTILHFLPVI